MATEELAYTAHKYLELCLLVLENIVNNPMFWGAFLGAWLVASSRKNKNIFKKMASFLLSVSVGYLFSPVALIYLPVIPPGVCGFICALVVIPLSRKLTDWIQVTDIVDLIRRFRGGK